MSIQYRNTGTQYGLVARVLHWISVVLLVTVIVLSSQFEDMTDSPEKAALIIQHSSYGLLLLILMSVRLFWRKTNDNPIWSYSIQSWQKITAVILHSSIYVIIIGQSLVGLIMLLTNGQSIHFFNWLELPALMNEKASMNTWLTEAHELISILIYPLFGLHILAAIYHQIFGIQDD